MAAAAVGGRIVTGEDTEEVAGCLTELWTRELLTVRTGGALAMDLLEEGRTGSSSSSSGWGVRATVEEVGTFPRMSESTCEDSFNSA